MSLDMGNLDICCQGYRDNRSLDVFPLCLCISGYLTFDDVGKANLFNLDNGVIFGELCGMIGYF